MNLGHTVERMTHIGAFVAELSAHAQTLAGEEAGSDALARCTATLDDLSRHAGMAVEAAERSLTAVSDGAAPGTPDAQAALAAATWLGFILDAALLAYARACSILADLASLCEERAPCDEVLQRTSSVVLARTARAVVETLATGPAHPSQQ